MLPTRTSPNFPAALRAARKAAGWTGVDFAKRIGVHPVNISNYERFDGKPPQVPKHDVWLRMNQELGFTVSPEKAAEGEPDRDIACTTTLADATIDQLVAVLRERGASVTLSFS